MQTLRKLFDKIWCWRSDLSNTIESTTALPICSAVANTQTDTSLPIKLHVICPGGNILSLQTDTSQQLFEIKNKVLYELSNDVMALPFFAVDSQSLSARYRLIRADYDSYELDENRTLNELEIANDEMLLMLERRNVLQKNLKKIRDNHGPTDEEVKVATSNVKPARKTGVPQMDYADIFQHTNLQLDIRKLIISIARASAAIIGAGPFALRLIDMLKAKLIKSRNPQQNKLQCLIDLGFEKELALHALELSDNVYADALDWLMQQQVAEVPTAPAVPLQNDQSLNLSSGTCNDDTVLTNTKKLLQIVQIYSRRNMVPNASAITYMLDMGFKRQDILDALVKTWNNVPAACEYLCSGSTDILVQQREGLPQDSAILKTILELPEVQFKLGDSSTFLAFLDLFKNECSINSILCAGNETNDIVRLILKTYHSEKQVLAIKQLREQNF